MEKIEITREEFKEKATKMIKESLIKEDDPKIAMVELLMGARIAAVLEKELFGKKEENKESN